MSDLGALVSWGANLAIQTQPQRSSPAEALLAIGHVLMDPTARRVGAALCVLNKISLEYPDLFLTMAAPASEEALRRLGYLLECGATSLLWNAVANRMYDLSDNSYEGFTSLTLKVRPSDYRKHNAELNLKWRVLSPTDVWVEYTKPGDRMTFSETLQQFYRDSIFDDVVEFCSYAGGCLGIKTGLMYSWYKGNWPDMLPDEIIQPDMIQNIRLCMERDSKWKSAR